MRQGGTNAQARREEAPRLEVDMAECKCGFSARTIRLSQDRSMALIGCKDGSVTAVPLAPLEAGQKLQPRQLVAPSSDPRRFGARALYDLSDGNLLVGRDLGGVDLVRWSLGSRQPAAPIPLEINTRPNIDRQISYLGRWGGAAGRIIVSARKSAAIIATFDEAGQRLVVSDELDGVEALSDILPLGEGRQLLVSRIGALWLYNETTREDGAGDLWALNRQEQPSYVFDHSSIKDGLHGGVTRGMYVSTSEGIFLLQPVTHPSLHEDRPIEIVPIQLPGLAGPCLAITHAVRSERCYLWVSDQAGTVHMFWDRCFWRDGDSAPEDRRPRWRRVGSWKASFAVLRSIASWQPTCGAEAVVSHACRNDMVAIAWYRQRFAVKRSASVAGLLSWGDVAELRERAGEATKDWCPEALLADKFEEAGETASGSAELRLFLRNPDTYLAMSILDEILVGEGGAERAVEALTMWSHALVGTIHRRLEAPGAEDYLGALRWLRRIERRFASRPENAGTQTIRSALEDILLQVRKWGLFGTDTYPTRANVVAAGAKIAGQQSDERALDRLVYNALIFSRGTNLEAEIEPPLRDTLVPWDVAFTSHEGTAYLAVAIQEIVEAKPETVGLPGRIALYRGPPGAEPLWRPLREATSTEERTPPQSYTRRILLGNLGGRVYLLAAPVEGSSPALPGRTRGSEITLCFLGEQEPISRLPLASLLANPAADDQHPESVYSLLALAEDPNHPEKNLVVVGLEGRAGKPRLGLLRIDPNGRLHPFRPTDDTTCSLSPSYPETKTQLRNPVWSMAPVPGEPRQIVVGCGDGQIWRLTLHLGKRRFKFPKEGRTEVGRLSAPVKALACSQPFADRSALRVFAGGADGTLIAYQRSGKAFTTLWATRERAPIAGIHPLRMPGETARPATIAEDDGAVLAFTQHGMAILVSDRPQVEPLRDLGEHRRLVVPGERIERVELGSTVFGSTCLPLEAWEAPSEGRVARAVIATGDGALRIVALHYPTHSEARKQQFGTLLSDLLTVLGGTRLGAQERPIPGYRIPGYLLRHAEITYSVVPALALALVRWVLSPYPETLERWDRRNRIIARPGATGPAEQWLPRYLRPLAAIDRHWAAGQPLGEAVRHALASARRTRDWALFRETLEVVLRRGNLQLFGEALQATTPESALPFAEHFLQILLAVEGTRGAWLAWEDDRDSKTRIVIAKILLDGDTLWSLARAAAFLGRVSPGSSSLDQAQQVLSRRTGQIEDFLDRGDELLVLETLRAANLALLRLCRRLESARPVSDWTSEPIDAFLEWRSLAGYFAAVGDYAARSAHRKEGMEEAIAHEVCRSYALGMLACPPAILRLAAWMAEADLPQNLIQQIYLQLDLLATILGTEAREGMKLTEAHQKMTAAIIGLNADSVPYEKLLFEGNKELSGYKDDAGKVGAVNVEVVALRRPFDNIVRWLHELANKLTDDAALFDQEFARLDEIYRGLELVPNGGESLERDQFNHSRKFWQGCLKALKNLGLGIDPLPARNSRSLRRTANIRPDAVLRSRDLAIWAEYWSDRLRKHRKEFEAFEPVYSLYLGALGQLQRAARRFREGAAVQKNVVLGVLGHGLVELLDEHVLELWEIAQAVDPRRTRERNERDFPDTRSSCASGSFKGERRRAGSTAAEFADYLLDRARNAETIPANLRNLQGLLSFTPNGRESKLSYREFFRHYVTDEDARHPQAGWSIEESEEPDLDSVINRRERHFLRLTLAELAQNDWRYGRLGISSDHKKARLALVGDRLRFELSSWFDPSDWKNVDRVDEQLQQPVPAHPDPHIPSHGTGLYLANLAAAAVGWQLTLIKFKSQNRLVFQLERYKSLHDTEHQP